MAEEFEGVISLSFLKSLEKDTGIAVSQKADIFAGTSTDSIIAAALSVGMSAEEIIESYKKLILVEKAFRNLKTVQLEIRPIYHKKDDRIRAHVFLCMLAYYVQWHMQKRLVPLAEEGRGKNRRWTFSNMVETLKQITINNVKVAGVELLKVSQPTNDQERILKLLRIKI